MRIQDSGFRTLCFLAVLQLLACSPQTQDYVRDSAVQPHMEYEKSSGVYTAADGAQLPYKRWLPQGKPKAIIVAVHGFNDYSNAFAETGYFFEDHGIAVYAYDQRGFGKTQFTGIWASEENLISDLRFFVKQLQQDNPRVPIFVLGESMGGAVAICALAAPDFPKVQGLILSAPAVWGADTMNPVYRGTLWLAAHLFPYKEFSGSDLKILASNNYPMLRIMAKDPLIIKRTRVDAVYGVVHLMDTAYNHIPDVKTPTLVLYGGKDQVIPEAPVRHALERFTVPVEYAFYPKGFHMLLRDIEREMIMNDILSWVKHPSGKLPSGNGVPFKAEKLDQSDNK